ncbi:MAG: hypothetical protein KC978_21275 [Candidatus Omnitrophica bacterium]|nr:hypothetical protein [Candidatus Omnitrophota bacterium]
MANPEKTFKVGPVRASVFRNPIQQNGKNILLPKVVIEVRYKDKSGNWKGTNSLSLNDLPKAVIALQSAYEYLLENKQAPEDLDPDDRTPAYDFRPAQRNAYPRLSQ